MRQSLFEHGFFSNHVSRGYARFCSWQSAFQVMNFAIIAEIILLALFVYCPGMLAVVRRAV